MGEAVALAHESQKTKKSSLRRNITIALFSRAVEGSQLPMTQSESFCIAQLMLKMNSASKNKENHEGEGCYVEVGLLESIRSGQFL
jgi:hypothetical protein